MSPVDSIQRWLRSTSLAGLIIPSTDEFLSEFAPPANRRLRWATGFRGSTGMAVILRDSSALFLEQRYLLQATSDVEKGMMSIEGSALTARRAWLKRTLAAGAALGLDPWLHSIVDLEQWRGLAAELDCKIELLSENPIDPLWTYDRPAEHRPLIVDYSPPYAGEDYQSKCAGLAEHVRAAGLQALLVADPEDVSWLLNVRAADEAMKTPVGDWHVVPSCTSRAIVWFDGTVTWFVESERLTPSVAARDSSMVTVAPTQTLVATLCRAGLQGRIGCNLPRTPAALAIAIGSEASADDSVARRRWSKHPAELECARRAHITDAVAVVRFLEWVTRGVSERVVSEFDAARALEGFRAEHPAYKGPSMPLMSASGPSGAQPHYVPRMETSRNLNDHPIFWMDSGGQYAGGTTDNTVTVALGRPEAKHILAHTLVLQGHIALAMACVPAGTCALRIDTLARHALWREGMDFAHGVGHGVGNCLNIHEGPVLGRDPHPLTTIPVEPGMIITNEPGYYVAGDFGLRIESHMIAVNSRHPNFVEFETISRLPIDARLVDFERLSQAERQWLAKYHRTVLHDLEPLLDASTATWLRTFVGQFIEQEDRAA